jgi:hypothetical protein
MRAARTVRTHELCSRSVRSICNAAGTTYLKAPVPSAVRDTDSREIATLAHR